MAPLAIHPPNTSNRLCYPTGLPGLDEALGGGLPAGTLVEISGPSESGKTALCLRLAGAIRAARPEALVVWADGDRTFNPAWLPAHGIAPQGCYEARPATLEQALELLEAAVRFPEVALAVLDGADGLPTAVDLEPVGRREHLAAQNNRLAAGARRLSQPLCNAGALVVITHGPEERGVSAAYHHLASGMERLSLKLLAGVRLRLEPGELIYRGRQIAGRRAILTVLKNPINPHHTRLEFDIMHY